MKVTAIKQQARRHDRYSIYVDDSYSFSLSEGALIKSGLYSGMEITAQQLAMYKEESKVDKVYARVLAYVARRSRSEGEIREYIQQRLRHDDVLLIDQIIEKLQAVGLVDDTAFVHTWMENRRLLHPVSKRRLLQELRKKHIDEDVIATVVSDETYSDLEALSKVVRQKYKIAKYRDDTQKLTQYLMRQGFQYDDVLRAIEEIRTN